MKPEEAVEEIGKLILNNGFENSYVDKIDSDQVLINSGKQFEQIAAKVMNDAFNKDQSADEDWLDTSKVCNLQDGECEVCQ